MEKYNLWPQRRTVAFRLADRNGQPRVEWDVEWEDDAAVDQILKGRGEHITKQQQAAACLKQRLVKGPMRADDAETFAKELGSGLIDQSQKMMVAAMQIAEKNVCAHRS